MALRPPVRSTTNPIKIPNKPAELKGYVTLDDKGYCVGHGVTLVDSKVCSAILCNYAYYRSHAAQYSDLRQLLDDFDETCRKAFKDKPILRSLIRAKINDLSNAEVQEEIYKVCGVRHSLEYISSLWRNKIPLLIASQAEDDYLEYYYTEIEKGKWKRCSRCGQIKLAHNKYFSRNSTSKDTFYSICKECRNKKPGLPIPTDFEEQKGE